MGTIPERDWKVLRMIQAEAAECFGEDALAAARTAMSVQGASAEKRHGAVLDVLEASRAEYRRVFGDMRRARAYENILAIRSRGLMEAEEFARFSEETRVAIER